MGKRGGLFGLTDEARPWEKATTEGREGAGRCQVEEAHLKKGKTSAKALQQK